MPHLHVVRLIGLALAGLVAASLLALPVASGAELLDEISVERVGNTAEIELRFTLRVQYLRHFPKQSGDTLRINVALVPVNGVVPPIVREVRSSPRNNLLPPFTVTFPDQGGSVSIRFSAPVSFRVGPGSDTRSIRIRVPLPEKEPAAEAPVVPAPPPASQAVPRISIPVPPAPPPADKSAAPSEVEVSAAAMMKQARAAIDAGDIPAAVDILNRLLNLPPNRFSQTAQELAGVARELNGEIDKARAEYELYLKLYPEGDSALRMRRRLAALGAAADEPRKEVAIAQPRGTEKMFFGTLSQYYYNGATRIDTVDKINPLPGSQQLSFTDQSALTTSIDLTGRVRRDDSDSRVVLRDTYSADLLEDGKDKNRLYAAYLEHEQKNWGLLLRGGRQSPPTGGVVERFDGGYLRKSLGRFFRVLGIAGEPADYDIDSRRRFYQAGVEIGREDSAWGLTLYGFEQSIDDIPDRRTVGGEARYFSNGSSIYSLVDYDVLFEELNIMLTQGNWQNASGTSINVILDWRKTPTLQTASALIGESTTSIQQLLDSGLTAEQLRNNAEAVTADATLYLIGVTQTLNGNWQVGGDVRGNRVSSTQGRGTVPAAPDTGTIYTYTVQTTATSIFGSGDVNLLSIGYVDAPTYSGPLVLLSNSTMWRNWRFEPSIRYYGQSDDSGSELNRISGGLRLSYRVADRISLEVEAGYEVTNTSNAFAEDKTQREFFSLGYRWDFD